MIFLGGSCNPTTWRTDIAIPLLESAGVEYYNPQVANWRPELVTIEARAKETADDLLFVIDRNTRAVASMIEATEYMTAGREVWLVVEDIADGTEITGSVITGRELEDLNNAREYLRDVATRYCYSIYGSVEEAVKDAIRSNLQ